MAIYQLKREQILPLSLEEAWEFFSSPMNLEKITPEYMKFEVKGGALGKMYPGQIISYTVSPVLGIPLFWLTEITHVEHLKFFVDEQRFGPYSFWHHQHIFEEVEGGVKMIDWVHYKLPLGVLGRIAHFLFVGKQLNDIFDYRYRILERNFDRK